MLQESGNAFYIGGGRQGWGDDCMQIFPRNNKYSYKMCNLTKLERGVAKSYIVSNKQKIFYNRKII